MDYSQEQIQKISEMAACFTPIKEIATVLDIDVLQLKTDIRQHQSSVSRAYHKAKAETSSLLRRQEIELAKIGSPLAVEHAHNYLLEMDSEEDL